MVSVTLNTLEKTWEKTPVEGVRVRIYSADGTDFVTEGDTESDGSVVFLLDDVTSYWVRFFMPGWKFPTKALIFVDEANGAVSFDALGTDLIASPTSTDPLLCRVTGSVVGPSGVAVDGVRVQFLPARAPTILGSRLVVQHPVSVVSGPLGRLEVDLIRTAVYETVVEAAGGRLLDDFSFEVLVPDQDAVALEDLLWPYVATVETAPALSMAVGDDLSVPFGVVLSSGQTTPFDIGALHRAAGAYVSVVVSDPAVLGYQIEGVDGEELLRLTAKAAGTATISFEVVDGAEAPRFPEPTRSLPEFTITVV